jgi:hypothetical protein
MPGIIKESGSKLILDT